MGRFGLQQARRCCVDEAPRNDARRAPRSIFRVSPLQRQPTGWADSGLRCVFDVNQPRYRSTIFLWWSAGRASMQTRSKEGRRGRGQALLGTISEIGSRCACARAACWPCCTVCSAAAVVGAGVLLAWPSATSQRASRQSCLSSQPHQHAACAATHTPFSIHTRIQIHTPCRGGDATPAPGGGGLCFMLSHSFIVFICMYIVYCEIFVISASC